MAQCLLDKLDAKGLAIRTGGNYVTGHTYYGLTSKGRAYVVENNLV